MTAANLIVRDDAAYLLTDSATLSGLDHRVKSLSRKVAASSELRFAITRTGETWETSDAAIDQWMAQQASSDVAVTALPELVAILRDDLEATYRRNGWPLLYETQKWPPPHCFHLVVATWSERHRRPEGYVVSSRGEAFYAYVEGVLPGGVYRMRQHITPPADPPEDPERDGLALLEAQRAWTDADGHHIVGGTAQLTTVSEEGVSTTVLRQWPDEVGRQIEPADCAFQGLA